ncbi:hypothetical protein D3C71_1557140 [compost metagenome]
MFKKLSIIGMIPMGIILVYGDALFKLILGEQWHMAGIYAMILAPSYYMGFVTSPLTYLFTILNKQKNNLILNIVMLLTRIISIIIGYFIFFNNSTYIVLLFGVVGFIVFIFVNGYVLNLTGISYKKSTLTTLIIFTLFSIIIALPRVLYLLIR